jgi:hypothetical protein
MMSKSRTTAAKRGRERLTFRRWALMKTPRLMGEVYREKIDADSEAKAWRKLGLHCARVVRVTVTVDPPRRRAGKAGKR